MAISQIIDDKFILDTINVKDTKTFKDLIDAVCNHVYVDIKLDSIFDVEKWLMNLLESEAFLAITKKRHRDHLLHACRIAILGEIILDTDIQYKDESIKLLDIVRELMLLNKDFKERFELYSIELNNKDLVNQTILQIWYISALFHDIGYVYESFLEGWKKINFLMSYPNFKDLYYEVESSMVKFQRDFVVSNTYLEGNHYYFSRQCDHGKIGACLISNLVGESNLLCDVASIIADNHTSHEIITFEKNPLSFLLILLDEVQDWGRPTIGRKMREQILMEKLEHGSPFLQNKEPNPELERITMQYDLEGKDDVLDFNLGFILDFGNNTKIITDKDYNYPWYLYSKYKNLQRLKVGDIKAASNNLFRSIADINLNISVEFGASRPLLDGLHKQYNILYFKTLLDNNNVLCDWARKYREKLLVKFVISNSDSLPKILNADYDNILRNAHETYLNDRNCIVENVFTITYSYKGCPDGDSVYWIAEAEKEITSSRKGIPVEGTYVTVDQVYSEYNVEEVSVNGNEIPKEKIKSTQVEGSENPAHNVRFAMYIPFEMPLYSPDKYIVKYKILFKIPFDGIAMTNRVDTYNNTRSVTHKIKLNVNWDKEIFDKYFKSGIMFMSSETQNASEIFKKVVRCDEHNASDSEIKAHCGIEHIVGHHGKTEETRSDEYKFESPVIELKPLTNFGFIWTYNI